MGFRKAQEHLDALGIDAMKTLTPTLHRVEALLEALDHPERSVPAIHVTGTNGKSSVARIASALLSATGLKVGTYTSPHLHSVTERIALNNEPIDEETFGEAFDHLRPYLEVVEGRLGETLSYFELLTALFFLWAADTPVDAAVIEVGLGGLWDATNVVDADVAVVTNIGLDHTELLGDRVSIATEKAGIVKKDCVVVTAEREPRALSIITDASRGYRESAVLDKDYFVTENKVAFGGRYLSVTTRSRAYDGLFLPLHGSHQGINAATALEAVSSFLPPGSLHHDVVSAGLAGVSAPGRLEAIRSGKDDGVPIVLDVAHNPEGMGAMVRSLSEAFAFDRVVFVVGLAKDKDIHGVIAELTRIPSAVVFTQARSPRAASIEVLTEAAASLGCPCTALPAVVEALEAASAEAGPSDLICVTGSHLVVGEARSHLLRS